MNLVKLVLAALLGGIVALGGWAVLRPDSASGFRSFQPDAQPARLVNYAAEGSVDFTTASATALPAVVHIRSTQSGERNTAERVNPEDMYEFFFRGERGGARPRMPRAASGSGVIISADGYIVTNNHVVADADRIEVVLQDNRNYIASIVGTDPSTDLALIRIQEKDLPYLKFGNSDALKIGEWVLAVGNPFDLTGTVTAGIVSARGRAIGILRDSLSVESFIQTDAAVNPGNSGGALINTAGELIGINTAIAGNISGTYAGYSFAIPATLVSKVVEDFINYGTVQRAFLGVLMTSVNAQLAEERKLGTTQGVVISEVNAGSAAQAAGLKPNDVILAVNDATVNTGSALQEQISRRRPGDKITLTLLRDQKRITVPVTLRNRTGNTQMVKREEAAAQRLLGAQLRDLGAAELQKLDLDGGVQVADLGPGQMRSAGIRPGFVITRVADQPVRSAAELSRMIEARKKAGRNNALVEGRYPDGTSAVYAVSF